MNLLKKLFLFFICAFSPVFLFGQGLNHQWLLGSYNFLQDPKGRMLIDSNGYNLINEMRKMPFKGTQGNISAANGNLLMYSNGYWIANAINDTMLNGSGINPGGATPSWPNGLPIIGNNVFLPYPGDSIKYLLLHHTFTSSGYIPELYLSTIDLSLDSGRGGIVNKNTIVIQDTLSGGIGACRHANGRDWWVVMLEDGSDGIYKVLLTDTGITNITKQNIGYLPYPRGNSSQVTFTTNGNKLIAATYDNSTNRNSFIVMADFDRCTGQFSNAQTVQLTGGSYLWGLSFSPSGNYAYACTELNIFQVNTTTLSIDTVATYDGFISPGPSCCASTFFNMYLAANGKIYITSGSGVRHFTEINYPDSAGLVCDVQQHSVFIGNYAHLSVPNHPNYYLGCDTTSGCPCLTTSINEIEQHDFKFSISPNPTNGNIKIVYLLPQNKKGMFEVYDVNGRKVFSQVLPPWSTLQTILLPGLANGIYSCVIESGGQRVYRKIAVVR